MALINVNYKPNLATQYSMVIAVNLVDLIISKILKYISILSYQHFS